MALEINDTLCIGGLNGEKYPHQYLVIVHYTQSTGEYRCTINKDRKEVEVRLHKTKQELIDTYLSFFGQAEIDKVKFRE